MPSSLTGPPLPTRVA